MNNQAPVVQKRPVTTTITLSHATWVKLKALATEERKTLTDICSQALQQYLDHDARERPAA